MITIERSIGGLLQEARETRKLSLEEVSRATKLSTRVLEALEAEEFQRLPGEIYTRAFIKAYADFLEIGSQVMQQFEKTARPSPIAIPIVKPKSPLEGMKARDRIKGLPKRMLIVLAFVLALVLVGAFAGKKLFDRTPSSTLSSVSAPEKKEVAQPVVATSSPAVSSAPTIKPPKAPVIASNALVLDILATGDVWMRVKADNLLLFEGTLTQNERESWKAQREYILRLGSAGAVDLYLNKVRLRKVGEIGEVKTVIINKEGIVKIR